MANKFIQELYDLADSKDDQGLSKFDEQKLRKGMEGNKKLMGKNSTAFQQEPKFFTCKRYNPCPICDKCSVKASHLYVECQTCLIPICVHTYKNKSMMIRRNNFSVPISKTTEQEILKLSAMYPKMEVIKNAESTR